MRPSLADPMDLTGPNFKYDQDMLLGLVNESQKRMMIWNIFKCWSI